MTGPDPSSPPSVAPGLRRRTVLLASVGFVALGASAFVALAGRPSETVPYGGPFDLVDQDGSPVTQASLLGRPAVLFFGFTACPEICPTTLGELSVAMGELGAAADRLSVAFVSVDPERDRPDVLKTYLSAFDPRIRGLTGQAENVAAMTKRYGVFVRRVPLENGDYTMDHTASVLLLAADGTFFGTLDFHEDAAGVLAKLKRLVGSAAS